MSRRSRAALMAALTSSVGLCAGTARGQANITWGNAAGGTFNVGGNWSGGVVPGVNDTPVFSLNSTYNVLFNNSPTNAAVNLTNGSVSFGSSSVVRTWTITGSFIQSGGAASLTVTNQPVNVNIGTTLSMSGNSQLFVPAGSDVTVGTMTIGNVSDALLDVRDSGSTFQSTGAGTVFIGRSAASGTVTFELSSAGTFSGLLGLADSGNIGSSGVFNVLTGADVHAASVKIGANGLATQTATLLVSGAGTTFTQTGASTLAIGAASASAGTLSVGPGAVFTSGTGAINVNATGRIVNTGGTVALNGTTTFTGTTASYDGGAIGAILNIAANTPITFNDGTATIRTLNLTNPGSTLTFNLGSSLSVVGTTTVAATTGGATLTCNNDVTASMGTVNIGVGGSGTFNVTGNAQVNTGSINIGSTDFNDNGTLAINGTGAAVIVGGAGAVSIGTSGVLKITAGKFDTGTGGFVVNGFGHVDLNGGTFTMDSDLTLTSGDLNKAAAANFVLATGRTLTAQNSGNLRLDGGLATPTGTRINVDGNASTVEVATGSLLITGGSTLSISNSGDGSFATLRIGQTTGNGTAIFDGTGTTIRTTSAGSVFELGQSGNSGIATFTNSAVGTFTGGIGLADSIVNNSAGTLIIGTGAQVTTAGNFSVGVVPTGTTRGFFSLSGGSSTFTQTGAASITIGSAGSSAGTVNILGGNFTSGTGSIQINSTGFLKVADGSLNAGGDLVLNGAGAKLQVGAANPGVVNVAGTLNIASGTVDLQGGTLTADTILNGDSISFTGSSSGASATVVLDHGGFNISGTDYTLDSPVPGSTARLVLSTFADFFVGGTGSLLFSGNLTLGGVGRAQLVLQPFGRVFCHHLVAAASSDFASITAEGDGLNRNVTADSIELAANSDQPGKFLLIRNRGWVELNAGSLNGLIIHDGAHVTLGTGTLLLGDNNTLQRAATGGTSPALLQMTGGTFSIQNLSTLTNFISDGGSFTFSSGTLDIRSSFTGTTDFSADAIDQLFPGTHTIGPSQAIRVDNGTTNIRSTLRLDGGTLFVQSLGTANNLQLISGQLTIGIQSLLLIGSGGPFSSLVVNSGMRIGATVDVGTLGLLQVNGGMVSGSSIDNSGEVELLGGASQINTSFFGNSGLLSGDGRISAPILNRFDGTVRALASKKLTIQSSGAENDGTFDLLGGTIELPDLDNEGRIIGQGNLIANTGGIANVGTILFSGGASTVEGNLTNNTNARVFVTGGSQTTFRNDVTNNGSSVFNVGSNSIATFFGTVTGLSKFTGPGTKIFLGPASGGPIDTNGVGDTVVDLGGAVVATYLHEDALQVTGLLTVPLNGTNSGVSRLNSLAIDSTGKFDVTDNDVILDYTGATPLGTILTYIQQGFAGGAWTGKGLTSSAAAAASALGHPTGLGYADASTLGFSAFDGQSVDNTTLLIRYTYRGDANLDGLVNALDFNALATNFGGSGRLWFQADFNYDGITNTLDFNSLAANFNQPTLASPPLGNVVPEPFSLALALLPLVARRRRGY